MVKLTPGTGYPQSVERLRNNRQQYRISEARVDFRKAKQRQLEKIALAKRPGNECDLEKTWLGIHCATGLPKRRRDTVFD